MQTPPFEEVQAQIQRHYQSGEYAAALALATRLAPHFPDQQPLFYYWQICMSARLGDEQQALKLLADVLDEGIWYGEVLLRKSPSLQALQGQPDFERLIERNRLLQAQDETAHFPLLTLRSEGECEAGGPPCPLLIALHGNGQNATASVEFWRSAAGAGWLVAVPQSTQAMWKGSFVWDDLEVTREQIQQHSVSVLQQYAVDPERIAVAGHSMGGEVAIWLALSGALPVEGFIAVAPGGPFLDDLDNWSPLIAEAGERGLRGYLIMGDVDDAISPANIQELAGRLNDSGIPCELEIIPDAGHDFVPEYEDALVRGLDFISLE